ncbi:hypothetical protein HifGL_000094 [Haemophilus influenzae KR494]|nr:hypothetical protein HifGL_000094 [Haemophilus influenzae KR494]
MKGEISKIQPKLTALYVKFPFFPNFYTQNVDLRIHRF